MPRSAIAEAWGCEHASVCAAVKYAYFFVLYEYPRINVMFWFSIGMPFFCSLH